MSCLATGIWSLAPKATSGPKSRACFVRYDALAPRPKVLLVGYFVGACAATLGLKFLPYSWRKNPLSSPFMSPAENYWSATLIKNWPLFFFHKSKVLMFNTYHAKLQVFMSTKSVINWAIISGFGCPPLQNSNMAGNNWESWDGRGSDVIQSRRTAKTIWLL